jgi:hypothetical protein
MVNVLLVEVNVPELIVKFPPTVKLLELPAVTVPVVVKLLNVKVVPEFEIVPPAIVIVPPLGVKVTPEFIVRVPATENEVLY